MLPRYQCSQCTKSYKDNNGLVSHVKQRHGDDPFLACKLCSYRAPSAANLARHQLVHSSERKQKCEQCEKIYKHATDLRIHVQLFHTEDSKMVCICPTCGYRADGKARLARHALKHSGERPFACSQCPNAYKRKSYLTSHVKQVHTDSQRFACKQCSHMAFSATNLQKHVRVHTGEKPYKCDVCAKQFSQDGHMKSHKRNVHLPEEVSRSHECKICGKCFKEGAKLKLHVRHLHDVPNEKSFKCPQCPKTFKRKQDITGHIRVHSDVRSFHCTFDGCDMTFKRKDQLPMHLRMHLGLRRYKCPKCDYRADAKSTMLRHYKSLHPDCDFITDQELSLS